MLHSFCSIFYRFPLLYVSLHLFLDHVVWFICWWIFGQKYLLIHWIDLIVLCGCKVLRQKLVARFICRDLLNWHFLPITDTSLNNPSMLLAVGILSWVTTKNNCTNILLKREIHKFDRKIRWNKYHELLCCRSYCSALLFREIKKWKYSFPSESCWEATTEHRSGVKKVLIRFQNSDSWIMNHFCPKSTFPMYLGKASESIFPFKWNNGILLEIDIIMHHHPTIDKFNSQEAKYFW